MDRLATVAIVVDNALYVYSMQHTSNEGWNTLLHHEGTIRHVTVRLAPKPHRRDGMRGLDVDTLLRIVKRPGLHTLRIDVVYEQLVDPQADEQQQANILVALRPFSGRCRAGGRPLQGLAGLPMEPPSLSLAFHHQTFDEYLVVRVRGVVSVEWPQTHQGLTDAVQRIVGSTVKLAPPKRRYSPEQ